MDVVKILCRHVWEGRVDNASINAWLDNFSSDDKIAALHLLAHFTFFGQREMRSLLQAAYRDLFRTPLVQQIRNQNAGTLHAGTIESAFKAELAATRFLGIGNPSESGTHLLYYFRQENRLQANQFINVHQIFGRSSGRSVLRDSAIRRYVFIDDFCGSGTQAIDYSRNVVEEVLALNAALEVFYFPIVGVSKGLQRIRRKTRFTRVDSVFSLDQSFKAFHRRSRYFLPTEQVAKTLALQVMRQAGRRLFPGHPLGYKDGQLLLGFSHNVPDNSLPALWADEPDWTPIFKRYPKE